MKKLALFLALSLMTVSFAACSGSEEATEQTPGADVEVEDTGDVSGTEGEILPPEAVEPNIGTFTLPKTYTNTYLGIKADFQNTGDNKWTTNTNDQNLEKNGFKKNNDGKYADQMAKADSFTDLYTYQSSTDSRVTVIYDNLEIGTDSAITKNITASDYINYTVAALPSTLAAEGIVIEGEISNEKALFAGVEQNVISYKASRNGVPFFQRLVIFKKDNFMITVSVTAPGAEDKTQGILDLFKPVEEVPAV